jgi:hypothetical protein
MFDVYGVMLSLPRDRINLSGFLYFFYKLLERVAKIVDPAAGPPALGPCLLLPPGLARLFLGFNYTMLTLAKDDKIRRTRIAELIAAKTGLPGALIGEYGAHVLMPDNHIAGDAPAIKHNLVKDALLLAVI